MNDRDEQMPLDDDALDTVNGGASKIGDADAKRGGTFIGLEQEGRTEPDGTRDRKIVWTENENI